MDTLKFANNINSHMRMLRSNALKFTKNIDDADDLVQETLIKAFRFSEKFEKGTNFKGWLFMIMRNTFINSYHKITRSRAVIDHDHDLSDQSMLYGAVGNSCTSKMVMDDIHKAIDQLPEVYRYPFLRYFEGYKYSEIAGELNIPLGTVKTHIHMAREILKKHLKTYHASNPNESF
ncbi:RNA polymerase sigma factor [Pedobacter endophyticus]|uniref:Sigma-70 family RNA polymerase sigma factor n=1 Tax=Pedobacter endophyticus TaxID=2789740 RepID=A0A7S9Q107_9SPHI|nr:sigma-70 family RNA polymerase sigma factor [Pedobacter endophyticus]QPH41272.1 sigma-70 family RNA polymerase sigma factor [Pedobacter endophyticus]